MTKVLCLATISASLTLLTACSTSPAPGSNPGEPAALGTTHEALFGTNRVHYLVTGRGEHTLVFVHCWSGNSGFWSKQVPALRDSARLILIDLPGHGQSDKPRVDYTMDFFAGAVLAVMRDAGVDRATLIGHSMGTPVTCHVYSQAPDKVAAIVAVDGMLRRPEGTPEQAEEFIAPFCAPDYRAQMTNFVGSMFPIPGTEALRDRVLGEMLATPQHVMCSAMRGMLGPDQPDWDLKHVPVPVLVINANSPWWNDEYKDYVRSLSPKTDYRMIEDAGHWLMLEKPAEFNAILVELLRNAGLIAK